MAIDPRFPVRKRIRLRNYDYSAAGAYFVTVCAAERKPLLGAVAAGGMRLSPWGEIVERCWLETPAHFPRAELDEWQVMPNHFHGILVIKSHALALGPGASEGLPEIKAQFGKPVADSLATMIGAFKSAVTKCIGRHEGARGLAVWQAKFYDHVVRDDAAMNRIREYIATNPMRWHLDRHNPERTGVDEFDSWIDSFVRPLS